VASSGVCLADILSALYFSLTAFAGIVLKRFALFRGTKSRSMTLAATNFIATLYRLLTVTV
jgi:hypothetical protein